MHYETSIHIGNIEACLIIAAIIVAAFLWRYYWHLSVKRAYDRGHKDGRAAERELLLKNSWTAKVNKAMEDCMVFKPSKFQGAGFVDGGVNWKREETKEG